MKGSAGFSLIELLVATLVMLTAAGAVFRLLDDGMARSALWNESTDLHQRARVAGNLLMSELRVAGAGASSGPLIGFFPPIDPRRRLTGSVSSSAITLRYVPANAPSTTLTTALPPGGAVTGIARHAGCPAGSAACGFNPGMDVVLFDTTGNWDTAFVQGTGIDALMLVDRPAARSVTYSVGAFVAQIIELTLYLESADLTFRREHPGVSNLPVLDNLVDLRFEYFGDPSAPVAPRPPPGVANCLYDAAGIPQALPILAADHGALAQLPVAMLQDGPMCGSGATAFDVDLLRIRKIAISMRLQTGTAALRGADPQLFTRPGHATVSGRMLPDLSTQFDVVPRNLQR